MDFLGIPGLLEPDQVRELLRHRQSERAKKQRAATPEGGGRHRPESPPTSSWPSCAGSSTAWSAAWHHRTGQPHGIIHAELRQECGGPPAAVATAEQLRARIDRIREWATRRTS